MCLIIWPGYICTTIVVVFIISTSEVNGINVKEYVSLPHVK